MPPQPDTPPRPDRCTGPGPWCRSVGAHDSRSGYWRGCRSGAALAEHRVWEKHGDAGVRLPAHVDARHVARRLQALAAAAWGPTTLARRLGRAPSYVRYVALGKTGTAHRTFLAEVDALFRELRDSTGPDTKARRVADRRRWAEWWEWVDIDDLDEPHPRAPVADGHDPHLYDAVTGGRVRFAGLPRVDQDALVDRLRDRGYDREDTAVRLRTTEGDVQRVYDRLSLRRRRAAALAGAANDGRKAVADDNEEVAA